MVHLPLLYNVSVLAQAKQYSCWKAAAVRCARQLPPPTCRPASSSSKGHMHGRNTATATTTTPRKQTRTTSSNCAPASLPHHVSRDMCTAANTPTVTAASSHKQTADATGHSEPQVGQTAAHLPACLIIQQRAHARQQQCNCNCYNAPKAHVKHIWTEDTISRHQLRTCRPGSSSNKGQ
jgi:hypothetical protein